MGGTQFNVHSLAFMKGLCVTFCDSFLLQFHQAAVGMGTCKHPQHSIIKYINYNPLLPLNATHRTH